MKNKEIVTPTSICSHLDVEESNVKICRKCERKVVEQPDGFKFFYLKNRVNYFTKRPIKKSNKSLINKK